MRAIKYMFLTISSAALFITLGCGPIENEQAAINEDNINASLEELRADEPNEELKTDEPKEAVKAQDEVRVTEEIRVPETIRMPEVEKVVSPAKMISPAPHPLNNIEVWQIPAFKRPFCGCGPQAEYVPDNPCFGYCTHVRCYDLRNFGLNPSFYEPLYRSLYR